MNLSRCGRRRSRPDGRRGEEEEILIYPAAVLDWSKLLQERQKEQKKF